MFKLFPLEAFEIINTTFSKGEEMAPRVEVSDITIPPWSINLVGLGDDCRFNHIDIPQCITYSYVSVSPHVKAVSAETAGTLLSQIAGLTSIATEQSLKARDEILRLKREKDVALRGKDEEILQLRKELEIALMNSGANSLADGKNHMNCGNGHNKNVQEKHVVGKQDLRVTGFSPFTDTEGDTSSEGKTTDVMSDSSSDDDWGVSNRERVFGWLPTNVVGWKVATRERDDTSDPPTTDRIPAPHTTDRKLVM
ncbi:hypothetical protein RchiOBHm_Chr3g0464171 [Rosa chinensis]|uniref:Uncharacterized protein n=1 Tax=Rosa chinensis TaxID=74649 RepID=A0A2P6R9F3_ROSCH|nr:hypothetical protein RchiOBHm_Chr3g0464171 [Rosa chinensis]